MPQVIIIDEIGTEQEAAAARTIAERGVQLVGTAHGSNLDNLLVNPSLNDLIGGIHTVTLSDEEARHRGTQKSVQERKAPPTFDVLVEIQSRDHVTIHQNLTETVDAYLRGTSKTPLVRMRDSLTGEIAAAIKAPAITNDEHAEIKAFSVVGQKSIEQEGKRRKTGTEALPSMFAPKPENSMKIAAPTTENVPIISVFPYGVSRSYLEQSIRDLHLPIRIQNTVERADVLITLKHYYKRKDSPIKFAENTRMPIQVLRSNTVTQIKHALGKMYSLEVPELEEQALLEAQEAMDRAAREHINVDLTPQNGYIRKLQHQFVEKNSMAAKSTGSDPHRHIVVMWPQERAS